MTLPLSELLLLQSSLLTSTVFSSGRNDKGQLGHGDTKRLEAPKLIEGLADQVIVSAACGRNHTMALTGGQELSGPAAIGPFLQNRWEICWIST